MPPADLPDGAGRTPLALAVKACVDSYWTGLRSPESAAALLRAGASPRGIELPTGYDEIDELLGSSLDSLGLPPRDLPRPANLD